MKKEYECLRDLVEEGKTPKDIEYIFMCWGDDPRIEAGIIVTNVKLADPKIRGYNFIDKETGEEMHTMYSWALMENSAENCLLIDQWKQKYAEYKEADRLNSIYRNRIKTLEK